MANDKWIDIGKNTVDTSKGYTINFDKVFNREDIVNMDMYQSPITAMFDDLEYKIREEHEKQIFEAVQNVRIRVDKEELIKALQYDRDQYRKGFVDAKREILDKIRAEVEMRLSLMMFDQYGNETPEHKEFICIIDEILKGEE